jgi:phosphoglucomutase
VLTGFKFICEVIKNAESAGKGNFIFGFEESYGYLKGTYARDKDSVVASMLICEMTAYYKAKDMTLMDALDGLYEKYGFHYEKTTEVYMEGLDGLKKMGELMDSFRNNPTLKVAELSSLSGFNSVVSYTSAFRLFMNETPSEWCRKERSKLLKTKK